MLEWSCPNHLRDSDYIMIEKLLQAEELRRPEYTVVAE